jgi:hypothetical protein
LPELTSSTTAPEHPPCEDDRVSDVQETDRASELRTGLIVGLGVLVAALPVGLVWWILTPLPRLVVRDNGVFLAQSEGEAAVAADGWFAVCAATAGLVAALVVFARIRRARVGALLGLTLGGFVASLIAWRFGVLLGPSSVRATAQGLADGARFDGPLKMSAHGVLFAWSLTTVVAYFALIAGLEPPAPARQAAGRRFPVTVLRPGYEPAEVDALFDRLESGGVSHSEAMAQPLVARRWRRGYDAPSVDAALAHDREGVSRPDPVDGSARPSPG